MSANLDKNKQIMSPNFYLTGQFVLSGIKRIKAIKELNLIVVLNQNNCFLKVPIRWLHHIYLSFLQPF